MRYWRLTRDAPPSGLARKLLARAMLAEYRLLGGARLARLGRPAGGRVLYLDPLYVLRGGLERDDLVLCHDVGPITHRYLFDAWTASLYERAYERVRGARCAVVFVSESTRREFVALYGEDYRLLRTIPLYPREIASGSAPSGPPGAPPPTRGPSDAGGPRPYVLMVAALERRKNHARTVEAFSRSALATTHELVLCGPRGNAAEEVAALAAASPNVRLLGRVDDAELAALYAGADAFVLPSLLEGFGVPAIEAARRGLPALVSAGGALEEAIGGHAVLVDPLDVDDIARGMTRLARTGPAEREGLVRGALARSEALSEARFLAAWRELIERESRADAPDRGGARRASAEDDHVGRPVGR